MKDTWNLFRISEKSHSDVVRCFIQGQHCRSCRRDHLLLPLLALQVISSPSTSTMNYLLRVLVDLVNQHNYYMNYLLRVQVIWSASTSTMNYLLRVLVDLVNQHNYYMNYLLRVQVIWPASTSTMNYLLFSTS